jgi:hypothetical protein
VQMQGKQDRHCAYNRILRRVRVSIVVMESITYSECVYVALVIQHAKRMRRVILSSVACLPLPHFSTLFHKRHDFRKNVTGQKTCVLIFSTNLSETFLIVRRIKRDITINVHRSSCKVPLLLSDFNET